MPLIYNGVTIPENVAGALIYNGVSLTQVIYNGVEIWKQSLFSGIWSGNSLTGKGGIETSGSQWRWNGQGWFSGAAPWSTVDSNGNFSANSLISSVGLQVSGNLIKPNNAPSWVAFDKVGKFSGNSGEVKWQIAESGEYRAFSMATSSGLMRIVYHSYNFDAIGNTYLYGSYVTIN